jgi:hypothetical protein
MFDNKFLQKSEAGREMTIHCLLIKKINKFGDLYSAYPAIMGASRRREQRVLPG